MTPDLSIVDLFLNQGPAWFMAGVFAWLFLRQLARTEELNRLIRGVLREAANLPDEDSTNGSNGG